MMYSLNKWILKNPFWGKFLYFITILIFFTENSFIQVKFFLQISIFLLAYGLWCRPFLKLVSHDLTRIIRKEIEHVRGNLSTQSYVPYIDRWERALFLNGTWLFFLIPIKLIIVDNLDLWGYDTFGWKLLFFLVIVFVIFYATIHSLKTKGMNIGGAISWFLFKNFCLLFILPLGAFLFIPFFFLWFYIL